jgi:hypothetical protein
VINFIAAANGNPAPVGLLSQLSMIAQIAFFAITATVAVLSYASAKRTFFQPLRTEIFKKQIEGLSAVLGLLAGKGEVDLRNDFHFHALVNANIAQMYDAYVSYAFGVERPESELEYRPELCPVIAALPEYLELLSEYKEDDAPAQVAEKPQTWEYHHHGVSFPRGYVEREAEVRTILDNPLLPRKIATMIENYLATVEDNALNIGSVIDECAPQMPDNYPTLKDLERSSYGWIIHVWTARFTYLEPLAKGINGTVRTYFDTDNLLPQKGQVNLRWPRSLLRRSGPDLE